MLKDNGNPDQITIADPKVEELIEQVFDNNDLIDELDPETRKKLLLKMGEMEQEDEPDLESVVEPAQDNSLEPIKEPEKEAGEKKVEKVATEPIDWKQKAIDDENEANKWKQKANSAKIRLEKSKKELEDYTKDLKLDDTLNPDPIEKDEYINFVKDTRLKNLELEKKLEFALKKLDERDNSDYENSEKQYQQTAAQKAFSAMNSVQQDFALKTSKSIEEMNNENIQFLDGLVKASKLDEHEKYKDKTTAEKRELAVGMYESDSIFRKTATDIGVKPLDWTDTDRENYDLLINLHTKAQNEGGSLREKYLGYLDSTGKLHDTLTETQKRAMIDGSNRAANAIENNSPNTLDPTDGSGTNPNQKGKLTLETANQTLETLSAISDKRLLTEEEKGSMRAALDFASKAMSE